MKILAFGASNRKQSINGMLANYVANLVENAEIENLDLNDYELPIFSIERGVHCSAQNGKGVYPKNSQCRRIGNFVC